MKARMQALQEIYLKQEAYLTSLYLRSGGSLEQMHDSVVVYDPLLYARCQARARRRFIIAVLKAKAIPTEYSLHLRKNINAILASAQRRCEVRREETRRDFAEAVQKRLYNK